MGDTDALRLLARRQLVGTPGTAAVEWAQAERSAGREGPALSALAERSGGTSWSQLDSDVRAAFSELGYTWCEGWDAVWTYAKRIAGAVVDGSMSPFEGLGELQWLGRKSSYPDELSDWALLDDGLNPTDLSFFADADSWADAIRERARALAIAGDRSANWPGPPGGA